MMLWCASKQTQLCMPVLLRVLKQIHFSSLITAPIYSLYHNHLLSYVVCLTLVTATLQCYIFGR